MILKKCDKCGTFFKHETTRWGGVNIELGVAGGGLAHMHFCSRCGSELYKLIQEWRQPKAAESVAPEDPAPEGSAPENTRPQEPEAIIPEERSG